MINELKWITYLRKKLKALAESIFTQTYKKLIDWLYVSFDINWKIMTGYIGTKTFSLKIVAVTVVKGQLSFSKKLVIFFYIYIIKKNPKAHVSSRFSYFYEEHNSWIEWTAKVTIEIDQYWMINNKYAKVERYMLYQNKIIIRLDNWWFINFADFHIFKGHNSEQYQLP